MCAKRGFTLVELLVVITIISLLIAITVPSLAVVRHIMKETSCLANLHTIGAAIQTYAGRYDNQLPPYVIKDHKTASAYYTNTKPGYMVPLASQGAFNGYRLALAFDNCRGDDRDLAPGNLGYCYREGMIASPESLYCPAFDYDGADGQGFHSPDEYLEPWGEYGPRMHWKDGRDSSEAFIAIGYAYNPKMQRRPGTAYTAGGLYPRYESTESIPAEEILAMDIQLSDYDWVAHEYRGPQWNVLLADSSARCSVWPGAPGWIDGRGISRKHEEYVAFLEKVKAHLQ